MISILEPGRAVVSTNWIVRKSLQRFWRWQRALTLGARGAVLDADNRVLLVRHTYVPGWTFPGGGVEFGETLETALRRELEEEGGIVPEAPPVLFGVFDNGAAFPGDHVALFVVRDWRQVRTPEPNREIAETGFFPIDVLPEQTTAATRRRIDEIMGRTERSPLW